MDLILNERVDIEEIGAYFKMQFDRYDHGAFRINVFRSSDNAKILSQPLAGRSNKNEVEEDCYWELMATVFSEEEVIY